MRLAVPLYTYPFHNVRHRVLLDFFSKTFQTYLVSLSTSGERHRFSKHITLLPRRIPSKIKRHLFSPLMAVSLNVIRPDVAWVFDTAVFKSFSFMGFPIVLDLDDPVFTPEELRLLRDGRVVKLVTTTDFLKRKFVELGVGEDRVEVVPSGVDTCLFKPSPLPEDRVVLYYGTFQRHRSELLVKVVERLAETRPDIRFILVGAIPEDIRSKLLRYGDRVEAPGYVEHERLPEYLKRCRICLYPQSVSLGGRLSIKLLEYMASGRPVVATDVEEAFLIKQSGAGVVTEINADAMASTVSDLIDDDVSLKRLAANAINYARNYDLKNILKQYARLIAVQT